MRKLVLCEKPSVARDLARALGVPTRGTGPYESDSLVITWCIGHLIELAEPASYQAAWRRWSAATLPMLPDEFALQPISKTAAQWRRVRDLLRRRDFAAVINACDAGREGELIFRFCYQLSGSTLPVERLWISSLTDQAIGRGMASLRPGRAFDALGAAARCRAEADWLVGLNATRAVTLWRGGGTLLSLGRVQTPTLSLIVSREDEITRFVARPYFEIEATLHSPADAGESPVRFTARFHHAGASRLATVELADTIVERDRRVAMAEVEEIAEKTVREPPPLLFDLGALQRTGNRRFGYSADQTLKLAQSLYEKHKLITYPRTDSRYLSNDLAAQLPRLFAGLAKCPSYAAFVEPLLAEGGRRPLSRRVFADHKVSDHHAIIPTAVDVTPARLAALSEGEGRIFDLIARRFLAAFYPDAEFRDTQVRLRVDALSDSRERAGVALGTVTAARDREDFLTEVPKPPDRYQARGRVRLHAGWQEVAGFGDVANQPGSSAASKRAGAGTTRRGRAGSLTAPEPAASDRGDDAMTGEAEAEGEALQTLPRLRVGQRLPATFARQDKQTRPPPRYSEATLLSAMEGAGQRLDDEALRQAMRDQGLGTPATRAAIIETLLSRGYIGRRGKQLLPTALGTELIHSLPVPALASAELTGRWEARLSRMARGEETAGGFMRDIRSFVSELVARVQSAPVPIVPLPAGEGAAGKARGAVEAAGESPRRRRGRDGTTGKRSSEAKSRGRTRARRSPDPEAGTRTSRRSKARTAAPVREPRRESALRRPRRAAPSPPETPSHEPAVPANLVSQVSPARSSGIVAPAGRAALGSTSPGSAVTPALPCPRCQQGVLLWGKRGWGCSNFRSCPLVLPFVVGEQRLTLADLRLLCGGQSLYLAIAGKTLAIRLQAGRSEAPFLVTV
jgi:DNA topoisomerase-3